MMSMCRVISCVVGRGCLLWPVHSLGKTLIPFAWFILHSKVKVSEVARSCLTLCDPMDCSLPGSSVHGIFQAIVLEWTAISFSSGSSQPRDRTQVSCVVDRRFTLWATTCLFLQVSLDFLLVHSSLIHAMIWGWWAGKHHYSHHTVPEIQTRKASRDMRVGRMLRSESGRISRPLRDEGKGEILGRPKAANIHGQAGATHWEQYFLEDVMEFPDILLGLRSHIVS